MSLMPSYCHLWTAGSVGNDESRALWSCAAVVRVLLSPFYLGQWAKWIFKEWLLYLMIYDMVF